jgi:hypothetical protein
MTDPDRGMAAGAFGEPEVAPFGTIVSCSAAFL